MIPMDTQTASREAQTVHRMMDDMTTIGTPDPVVYLNPSPEAVAAKKARRRMGMVRYDTTQSGGHAPHHFGEDGFDAFGYDRFGQYDATHRLTDLPSPFTHDKKD